MRHPTLWPLVIVAWASCQAPLLAVDYDRDVKPILRQHCYSCHGALRQKSGLRLDHVSFIRKGGNGGLVVDAASGQSRLILALQGKLDGDRMPLDAKPLADEQIATLAAWIDGGAIAPDEPLPDDPRLHWSFQKPVRAALPVVADSAWAAHPVDRFVAAEHERHGLKPAPEATKNLLLRRVYLDLIGLPPTLEETRAFLADASLGAYELVVDQLLASPAYGERWGRHWMDVWRYSDWDGFGAEVRESQPHIWRWRDWIIESLNADKPYDEMVCQMLAADELAPDDLSSLRAGGYLARNWYRFNRNVWLEATVEHTAKAFLGVTIACARCHDHMYDPILQTDYYQFRAVFEPHDVRTDRLPGQSDTKRDGLVRAYDLEPDKPTYLFVRGSEARSDKEHPLAPGVPLALGGDPLAIHPVAFEPTAYYPGLRAYVQQESLSQAQAELERTETALGKATVLLAGARKKLSDFTAASSTPDASKPAAAGDGATPAKAEGSETNAAVPGKVELAKSVDEATTAAQLAEQGMLAAAAKLAAARATIAADVAAFARPPAENAKQLAIEANRAERIANVEQARHRVLELGGELAKARAEGEAQKKNADAAEKQLGEARTARDTAQAALGKPGETYTHLTPVYPSTSTGRRSALARWITSKNNPLAARVAINHIWMRHFGAPLVPTVFDFGLNGKKPTHPALLDWLAVELMEGGWRTKPIHRLIVTSTAYRMRSGISDPANLARDPENVFLWRMNARRMEAEVVRDSTLRLAENLDLTMFGPDLDPADGQKIGRRSIYFRSSKEKKVPFLDAFDSANVVDCYRRSETIVPQQALAMVNSSLTLGQSRRLAAILQGETTRQSAGADAFVAAAFERILCRPPRDEERAACVEFLATQSRSLADPAPKDSFATGPENPVKPSADPEQRARENLVHVLLNHNDFLTVR
jgi:hypothetical protein